MDSDVIAHNYEGQWNFEQEKKYDLIFYERWFNGEVVAGGYGVKVGLYQKVFSHQFNFQFYVPNDYSPPWPS